MRIETFVPLAVVALFVLYAFLRWRLIESVQPIRLKLADRGEALLGQDGLPTAVRVQVEWKLNSAFGNGLTPWLSVVALPVFIARIVLFDRRYFARMTADLGALTAEQRVLLSEVDSLYAQLRFAHHPIAWIITTIEITLMALAGLLALAVLRRAFPAPEKLSAARDDMEQRESRFMPGFARAG